MDGPRDPRVALVPVGGRVNRPRLLDLCCGAGGVGVGYQRAGFDVTGVDLEPHPTCPFPMLVADIMDVLTDGTFLDGFDVIHASTPCQAHTTMSNRWRGAGGKADSHTDLIGEVRALLGTRVHVQENVCGARPMMRSPLLLHGGMFGLRVNRPRLFEVSVPIGSPPYAPPVRNPVGVYGRQPDGRRLFTRKDGTMQRAAKGLEEGRAAMGIDWMDWHDLTEAIPPAYTEWLGRELIATLALESAA